MEFSPYPDKQKLIDEGHIFGFEGASHYFPDPAGNMLVTSPEIIVETTLPSRYWIYTMESAPSIIVVRRGMCTLKSEVKEDEDD